MSQLRSALIETAEVLETVRRQLPRVQPTRLDALVEQTISKVRRALEQDMRDEEICGNAELLDALQDVVELLNDGLPWIVIPEDRDGNLRIAVAILRAHRILQKHHRIRVRKHLA